MVVETFGSLLQELAADLHIPNLYPDEHDSCLLLLQEGIKIQLELDPSGQSLIIGIDLGPLLPGKYRTAVFQEALKANDLSQSINGVFAFSEKTQHLILFQSLDVKNLRGHTVASNVASLKEKALAWAQSLSQGQIPNFIQGSSKASSGMFGL